MVPSQTTKTLHSATGRERSEARGGKFLKINDCGKWTQMWLPLFLQLPCVLWVMFPGLDYHCSSQQAITLLLIFISAALRAQSTWSRPFGSEIPFPRLLMSSILFKDNAKHKPIYKKNFFFSFPFSCHLKTKKKCLFCQSTRWGFVVSFQKMSWSWYTWDRAGIKTKQTDTT